MAHQEFNAFRQRKLVAEYLACAAVRYRPPGTQRLVDDAIRAAFDDGDQLAVCLWLLSSLRMCGQQLFAEVHETGLPQWILNRNRRTR